MFCFEKKRNKFGWRPVDDNKWRLHLGWRYLLKSIKIQNKGMDYMDESNYLYNSVISKNII